MASSWILFFSYQDDARSNTHQSKMFTFTTASFDYSRMGLIYFIVICQCLPEDNEESYDLQIQPVSEPRSEQDMFATA